MKNTLKPDQKRFNCLLSSILTILLICHLPEFSFAQYLDETRVPDYRLPALLQLNNGHKINSVAQWEKERRPELIQLLKKEMYGQSPKKPRHMVFKIFDLDKKALNGKAIRKQIRVTFNKNADSIYMDILLYLPNHVKKPMPLIVGLNFGGNQEVINDTAIRITHSWVPSKARSSVAHHATAASRGAAAQQWPVEQILEQGYAFATVYHGDIDPDYNNNTNGVQALYPDLQQKDDNFSSIGAWAWGLSRAMDYFEKDPDIDAGKVVLTGLSRLGKAALWAGALDKRFAIVISTESGKGGDALFHREFGESVQRINTVFPQWFCKNFRKYSNQVNMMPFDQHMVLALIAPRPLYVGSAQNDLNEDPKGEFLALKATEPVYKLYHYPGLPVEQMPEVNDPIAGEKLAYHIREGGHGITPFDWSNYLKFINKQFSNDN